MHMKVLLYKKKLLLPMSSFLVLLSKLCTSLKKKMSYYLFTFLTYPIILLFVYFLAVLGLHGCSLAVVSGAVL